MSSQRREATNVGRLAPAEFPTRCGLVPSAAGVGVVAPPPVHATPLSSWSRIRAEVEPLAAVLQRHSVCGYFTGPGLQWPGTAIPGYGKGLPPASAGMASLTAFAWGKAARKGRDDGPLAAAGRAAQQSGPAQQGHAQVLRDMAAMTTPPASQPAAPRGGFARFEYFEYSC